MGLYPPLHVEKVADDDDDDDDVDDDDEENHEVGTAGDCCDSSI